MSRGCPDARLTRRGALAALAGFAVSARAQGPDRAALLARAEAALRAGDPLAALDDFERASLIVHAPDAELGSIRAAMQSGQYRRALAFCAHTAGEHLEETEGGALYAWLLRAGGQTGLAERVLQETLARSPEAPVPLAVRQAFAADLPVANGVLLEPPQRMAPYPRPMVAGDAPPVDARSAGGGVLVGNGSRAIVPQAALAAGRRLWVRNGLGETVAALPPIADPDIAAAGLALVPLAAALDPGPVPDADVPEPFAGSPGHALRFAGTPGPAWPWLAQGFLGAADRDTGLRRLGFPAGDAPGAAVLDATGRLAGIVVATSATNEALWVPSGRWRAALGLPAVAARSAPAGPRTLTSPDAVYEAGLRRALKIEAS